MRSNSPLSRIRRLLIEADLASRAVSLNPACGDLEAMLSRIQSLRSLADDVADATQPTVTNLLHGRGVAVGVNSQGMIVVDFAGPPGLKSVPVDSLNEEPA